MARRASLRAAARGCALATLLAAAPGCVVPPVDLANRRCPCASGWSCDDLHGVCVESSSTVSVTDLRPVWSTPNTVRWSWTPDPGTGAADRLAGYELAVSTRADDLATLPFPASVRVYTVAENPELGRYYLPRQLDREPLHETSADGLEPDQLYYARLVAVDTLGRRASSNVASARTALPPTNAIPLFTEGFGGFAQPQAPDTLQVGGGRCYGGTATCASFAARVGAGSGDGGGVGDSRCVAPSAPRVGGSCWENLRLNGMPLANLASMGAGGFETAYLEFALATTSHSYYSETVLWIGTPDTVPTPHKFHSFSPRADGMYRVFQVPLRALDRDGALLTYAALMAVGGAVYEVGFGAAWDDDAEVQLDEVFVRW